MAGMDSRILQVPLWLLSGAVFLTACGSPPPPAPAARESQDAAFAAVAHEVIEDLYRRQPSAAVSGNCTFMARANGASVTVANTTCTAVAEMAGIFSRRAMIV